MRKLIAILFALCALAAGGARAATGGYPLDRFPTEKMTDMASLQHGAKLFVNYCLNCHSAAFMRFNRLRDLGLTDEQIKRNLLFPTQNVGDLMKASIDPHDAKQWFGATPPDLTVVARSRASGAGSGADYLYTYLRTYYRDDTRPTGWNNMVFPSVGMPNPLWELQGARTAKFAEEPDPHDHAKTIHVFKGFEQTKPGTQTTTEFDNTVADLVAFMQWMGEPQQQSRVRLGVWVLMFLALFTVVAWRLNAAYWKDIK